MERIKQRPTMEVVAGDVHGDNPIHVRIQQEITESVQVVLAFRNCDLCGLRTPLPDPAGLDTILHRTTTWLAVVHPDAPRDWFAMNDRLLCPKCYEELRQFMANKRKEAGK